MLAYFERGFALQMTKAEAESASHRGDCQDSVRRLMESAKIKRQLRRLDLDKVRAELKDTGGWTEEELADDAANLERLVWLAACQIREEAASAKR